MVPDTEMTRNGLITNWAKIIFFISFTIFEDFLKYRRDFSTLHFEKLLRMAKYWKKTSIEANSSVILLICTFLRILAHCVLSGLSKVVPVLFLSTVCSEIQFNFGYCACDLYILSMKWLLSTFSSTQCAKNGKIVQ